MPKRCKSAAVRSLRFTAGDLSAPVDFTLGLRRTQAEPLLQDLQRILGEYPADVPLDIVSKWMGTLEEVTDHA